MPHHIKDELALSGMAPCRDQAKITRLGAEKSSCGEGERMSRLIYAAFWFLNVSAILLADETASIESSPRYKTPKQPHLVVDPAGQIHLTFGSESSIFYCDSTDQGKSFREPVLVAKPTKLSLGMRRGPRVAVSGQNIMISAITGELGGGKDGDLTLWLSKDQGKTWSTPTTINDQAASAREGLHAMIANEKRADCVWLDLRNKRTELWLSTSTDNGTTWSKNKLVYQSPEKSICECCHPSLCYDASGKLVIMWRNSIDGKRDMYLTTQQGDGTIAPAIKLGAGTWEREGCPMDGGSIALNADGKLVTVWRREADLLKTQDDPTSEELLGIGMQPVVAATAKGPYIAWIGNRPGYLQLLDPSQKKPQKIADRAIDPALASSLSPGAPLVLAWEQQSNGKAAIYIRTVVP